MRGNERIVVGVDGSPPSIDALRWAVREAGVRGASVNAVCAWDYPALAATSYGGAAAPVVGADEFEHAARTALDKALAEVGASEVRIEAEVVGGHAAAILA